MRPADLGNRVGSSRRSLIVFVALCREYAGSHFVGRKAGDLGPQLVFHARIGIIRDTTDVNDVADGHVTVIEQPRPGPFRTVRLEGNGVVTHPVLVGGDGDHESAAVGRIADQIFEVEEQRVFDEELDALFVHDRSRNPIRPGVGTTSQLVVRTDIDEGLFRRHRKAVQHRIRAGDVGTQRVSDLGRSQREFLEDQDLWFNVSSQFLSLLDQIGLVGFSLLLLLVSRQHCRSSPDDPLNTRCIRLDKPEFRDHVGYHDRYHVMFPGFFQC